MKLKIAATALAVAAAAGIAFASTDRPAATTDTTNSIATALAAKGYQVQKVEAEDGGYEAKAFKDGQLYEIYLDKDLNILRSEIED